MKKALTEKKLLFRIQVLVLFFIGALLVAGFTAFPLETELKLVSSVLGINPEASPETYSGFKKFIAFVTEGVTETNVEYPFLSYGTDWLAFAHIVIAIAFVAMLLQPIRYKWLIYWAMIACVLVIPTALICGAVRQIPLYWQLVDCSFGVFGLIPLYLLHRYVNQLEVLVNYPDVKY